jgi:hypothetical protein
VSDVPLPTSNLLPALCKGCADHGKVQLHTCQVLQLNTCLLAMAHATCRCDNSGLWTCNVAMERVWNMCATDLSPFPVVPLSQTVLGLFPACSQPFADPLLTHSGPVVQRAVKGVIFCRVNGQAG